VYALRYAIWTWGANARKKFNHEEHEAHEAHEEESKNISATMAILIVL
jgi:hypothetical protein